MKLLRSVSTFCSISMQLWMGTHPKGHSYIGSGGDRRGQTLEDYVASHPDSLGDAVADKFGRTLPFLFKVLSIEKALSIQVHPNKVNFFLNV